MKIYYDDEVDALYINLSDEKADGVIEVTEGVNLDTTSDNRIVGLEILSASKKVDLKSFLNYSLEFEKNLISQSG